jgi:hypothetical protein
LKKKDAEEIRDYHSKIISDNLRYINYGILIAFFSLYIHGYTSRIDCDLKISAICGSGALLVDFFHNFFGYLVGTDSLKNQKKIGKDRLNQLLHNIATGFFYGKILLSFFGVTTFIIFFIKILF